MNLIQDAYVRHVLVRFTGRTQRGATAVEYGLLLALIVLVAFGGMVAYGEQVAVLYGELDRIAQTAFPGRP